MAKRSGRTRAARRSPRDEGRSQQLSFENMSDIVPGVLLGAVDGVGMVAGGALHLARNVLVSAVSGAADIGAEALTATVSGARGVVSAASRMVGDVAGAARTSLEDSVSTARLSSKSRRPLAVMPSRPVAREAEASANSAGRSRARRRTAVA
jgi:hypothetical protein